MANSHPVESEELARLRKEYNQLAESVGWKHIRRGKWRRSIRRLAEQLKDLKDCIQAGLVTQAHKVELRSPPIQLRFEGFDEK